MKHLCALKYPIYLNYFIGNEAWGYWKPFPNVSITNLSYDLSKIETLKRLKKAKVSENQPNSIPAPEQMEGKHGTMWWIIFFCTAKIIILIIGQY